MSATYSHGYTKSTWCQDQDPVQLYRRGQLPQLSDYISAVRASAAEPACSSGRHHAHPGTVHFSYALQGAILQRVPYQQSVLTVGPATDKL